MKPRAGVFVHGGLKYLLIKDVFRFSPPAYWILLSGCIWDICDRVLPLPPTQRLQICFIMNILHSHPASTGCESTSFVNKIRRFRPTPTDIQHA